MSNKSFYKTAVWINKREDILKRDNYECQRCKKLGKLTIDQDVILEIHHIKHLEDYPELALEDSNLITVCKSCHNFYHKRFEYSEKNKVNVKIPERW